MAERCPRCGGQDVRRTFFVSGAWVESEPQEPAVERVLCRSLGCLAVCLVQGAGRLRREAILALADRWESRRALEPAPGPRGSEPSPRRDRVLAAKQGRHGPVLALVSRKPDRRTPARVAPPWRTP